MTIKHLPQHLYFSFCNSFSTNCKRIFGDGKHKIENKDYRNALEFINRAIQLNDTNQWYPIQKAEIEFNLYGPTEALSVIFKAMSLNRKNSEFYNRAGIYYESGVFQILPFICTTWQLGMQKAIRLNMFILNRGTAKAGHRDFEGASRL
ncbi:MAG: hypothetical protein IPH32_17865 [Bacteroidetes bacterium]|nr:hypothetical protein [Bacteroidota bacterium]